MRWLRGSFELQSGAPLRATALSSSLHCLWRALPMRSVVALIPILGIDVFTALERFSLAFAFACRQKVSMFGRKHELLKELKTRLADTIG